MLCQWTFYKHIDAKNEKMGKRNPADYGLGNVENIMKQVHKLLDK